MFLDESSSVRRKARAGDKTLEQGTSPCPNSLIVPSHHKAGAFPRRISPPVRLLHSPLEDQAVAFFFSNYADIGPRSSSTAISFSSFLYQQDRPDGAVRTIIRALGLGGLSRIAKDVRMRNAAISNYVSAMSKINELLRHPTRAKEDITLFAILSLAVFEVTILS